MVTTLEKYREKRDFQRTTEPLPESARSEGPLSFVVQKHRARQLHYDFRLELEGTLKSWSVPKGPSLNPEDKRLAVMVEDHPLAYATFEGTIPKGEYGAGEVIVWDNGAYSPDEGGKLFFTDRAAAEEQMRLGLEKGKVSFTLRGHKLKGSWTLVKLKKKKNDWLLMKHRDEYASKEKDILQQEQSVLPLSSANDPALIPGAHTASFPDVIAPMFASLAEKPFSNPEWIFEPKLDGYRITAQIRNGEVTLLSRNGNNVNRQYPSLILDLAQQPASELILDGELIAMDEKGRQCFQCLQNYLRSLNGRRPGKTEPVPLVYYVFDILYLDGYDLRGASLRARKELLQSFLKPTEQVRLIDYFEIDGETVYQAALKNGLEGVIAKQTESVYESGKRSRNWLKVKAMLTDEFVIGGYSVSEKGRKETFSSLLLGYFDNKGKLIFAGHVGTGFDETLLKDLKKRLDTLKIDKCPFAEEPLLNAPTVWVKPELIAGVKFSEWTQDGRLRIPVFLRLREDKLPAEVCRAEPIITPTPSLKTNSDDILKQLQNTKDGFILELGANRLKLSNLDKELWPETPSHSALTKRNLLTYLAQAADYLLPHLKDRPLTLTRYPNGIAGEHFYQKHRNQPVPEFVERVNIREDKGTSSEYLLCNNLSTLLWLGQLANLEFHTWYSRIRPEQDMERTSDTERMLDHPDFIVFDLDPYIYSGKELKGDEPELNRQGFARTVEVAFWLKEVLDELTLNAFVKTSGRTGLHIYVPIIRNLDYKSVRSAAEIIGRFLLQRHPRDITMEWALEKRTGKVFVDYGQNVRGKTLASVYSPRPTPEATVSTALDWKELGKVYPTDFTLLTLPERLKKTGDLWKDILSAKKDLSKILEKK